MAGKEIQFLGFVYEGAFKIGFLEGKIEEEFKESVFYFLEETARQLAGDDEVWLGEVLSVLDAWRRNEEPNVRRGEEGYIMHFLYKLGKYQGYLFSKSFSSIDDLIKVDMITGSGIAGSYENADLIFIADKCLYVIDFKLGNAKKNILDIFNRSEYDEPLDIPFEPYGYNTNISTGKIVFNEFVRDVFTYSNKFLDLEEGSYEVKGVLQLISYALDFLLKNKDKRDVIDKIWIALFYPFSEGYKVELKVEGQLNEEEMVHYSENIKKVYKELKNLPSPLTSIDTYKKYRNYVKEINEDKIKDLIREIEKRQEEIEEVIPDSIVEVRESVVNSLEEFFKKEEPVKVCALLHSAGGGKTSNVRGLISKLVEAETNPDRKHIVLYFSTRRRIVDREFDEYVKLKGELEKKGKKVRVMMADRDNKNPNMVKLICDSFEKWYNGGKAGFLKTVCMEISDEFSNYNFIVACLTQQSIVETRSNNNNNSDNNMMKPNSTAYYMMRYLLPDEIIDNATIHVIVDEVLGYDNGLMVIEELSDFFSELKKKGGRGYFYILDANLYSGTLLNELLEEYKAYKSYPPALVFCDYKEKVDFDWKGLKFYCYTKHGYPAPKISFKRRFFKIDNFKKRKDEISKKIGQYIMADVIKENRKYTALVFIQDKDIISMVKKYLRDKGIKCGVITADSSKGQEEINKGDEDVLIMTSVISRGIDIARDHKPVKNIYILVSDFAVEGKLAEVIQVLSRARGNENTEKLEKTIHLLYEIKALDGEKVEEIKQMYEIDDDSLIRTILSRVILESVVKLDDVVSRIIKSFFVSNKEERVLVPIPKQYRYRFISNMLSDLEGYISFIRGLSLMIDDKEKKRSLDEMLYLLDQMNISVENIDFEKAEYYHPYLLLESCSVKAYMNDKLIKAIENKLNEILPILNEHNSDRAKEFVNFVKNELFNRAHNLPVIVPSYSVILTNEFLNENEKRVFKIRKTIGRGEANTLMGVVYPLTYCIGKGKEYACIPLGEDYYYKEVLSGRFAKFPISLLELLSKKEGLKDGN